LIEKTQQKRLLPTISVITFLGFLDTHLLIPVMALYATELGAGLGITGLIIGLYSITNTPANILFGRLIDKTGYKYPLCIGLIIDALGMFLYTLCHMPLHLALVRVFHGLSGGLIGPSTMSATAEYSQKTGKGRAMGVYGMAMAATTLVGYGVSGVVVSKLGFQWLFFIGAGLLIIGALLTLTLPGGRKGITVTEKTTDGQGLGVIKELFKRRDLRIAYSSIFAQYFTFGGVVTLLPLHIKQLGMEAYHVGILLATFAVAFIIVQFPGGLFSDRFGRRIPTMTGLCLCIVALVLLSTESTLLLLIPTMAFYGIAYGLLFPSISAMVVDSTAVEERGIATGVFHALLTAGVAIGAPVLGWIGEAVGITRGLILAPSIIVVVLLVTFISYRRA